MKLLLLILTLMIGCAAEDGGNDEDYGDDEDDVEACIQGWVQFTCEYPETNKRYDHINVVIPNGTSLRSSLKDVWEDKGRFSLYHDTKHKTLMVGIRDVKQADFGTYSCEFDQSSNTSVIKKLESEKCQQPFTQIVTRAAKIMCDYPDDDFKSGVQFFCSGENFTCKDILSTKGQNGKFRLTNTNRGFNVSIRDVSSQDAGVYWCGVESKDGSYRVSIRQIKLEVEEPPTTKKPSTTSSTTSSRTSFTTSSTSLNPPASATSSTTQTPPVTAGSPLTAVITVTVLVALLLLVVVVVFTYKCFSWSKYRKNGEAQNKEHHIYDAIQESSQKSITRPAIKTVYATANFPTNPSVFMHESKVNVKNISGEADSGAYFNLWKPGQRDKKSTANHPSRVSNDPFYSVVAMRLQH
ncbi:junctional adhesion molecule-like [Oreochromis aureus]|uniref:junctional adhesion molecule-like n=1 Tax=Oreochromis aureus TaxID=47969 RepID=UPI001952D2F8|nr:junctional adhesion molecule-like [Oreochromis aureus]